MASYIVDLDIPKQRFVAHYAGLAQTVVAVSRSGLKVRFPARALTQFVTRTGVYGSFRLFVDDKNRLATIEQISGG